jgi:hypothetical protein
MYDKFVPQSENEPVEGSYNDPPPNFREVTEKEIAKSDFFVYSPKFSFFRQIDPDRLSWDEKYFLSVHFYGMSDGTGYGIATDNSSKVRWFRYGCSHKYVEKGSKWCSERGITHWGMCYHVYECSECGHVLAQDSSD